MTEEKNEGNRRLRRKDFYGQYRVERVGADPRTAYKPASEIITNIDDTVAIDTIIKPVFNFKASK